MKKLNKTDFKNQIIKLTQFYRAEMNCKSPQDISSSHGYAFAEDLVDSVALDRFEYDFKVITEEYFKFDYGYALGYKQGDEFPSNGWNIRAFAEYETALPPGVTIEMLNQFEPTYHVWFQFDGNFYDAECPDGVPNILELPIYKRALAAVQ